jgi:hypothetical protein
MLEIEDGKQIIKRLPSFRRRVILIQIRVLASEKKAKKQATTFVEVSVGNCAGTTKELLYQFDLLYGQKNRKQRAIRNLSKISQGKTKPFTSFYSRFEKKDR